MLEKPTSQSSSISHIVNILTIAGSDSGGGAGIQADIKAISATGSYACSVITALTAQNTQGVSGIYSISAEFIGQQLDAVFQDIDIAAVKIGMLNDCSVIKVIAEKIKQYQPPFVVLDPVMVATSGDPLIQISAIETLKEVLFPLVSLITPNLPEAALLIGSDMPSSEAEIEGFIVKLRDHEPLNNINVLLKGGHFCGEQSNDWLVTPKMVEIFSHKRVFTKNTHGTGCTLSSAIASYLGQGYPLTQAIDLAKTYLSNALVQADLLNVGKGAGPVHHFYNLPC
ncbi:MULTISPECIES: bifunctional hydroxymethylpyrimidine kinase/phosphomethylpyrimidine kinase [Vibrio]|uniref:hydroxymethylpyrimidine kinase n=1 Tax=Vibrio casei TaxID=673372 RepID=A0A368LN53_9VIBR|nr:MULTISPECIES: bifunctional hydroxymethylpyrimidine kinase/phosphomethylpyrimidine kinase [Vibrio]RCS73277.1 bifunctional hydroxymethylpyrimidine kinase/phosphomethylpyrimidine kinase [Vibrio casei]SJN18318.1 Hydroxymethylpyrimidine phosphate kinase ThiD [Vibrio casei]HBV75744.1 bifunctional hydroxymethylpyrimidine kinase/phosphomethylpyrimidine kinase [Vibrio sp.]